MFLSWSRSTETGWSRTVKVHPSFSSWSSSRFCGSLRGFCSGPTDRCTQGEQVMKLTELLTLDINDCSTWQWEQHGRVRYLLVSLYLCDQQEFVKQEEVNIYQLCVLWWGSKQRWLKHLFQLKQWARRMCWQQHTPVSTSFPSCSRLLWVMRFSKMTVFRRCFRFWKRRRHSGVNIVLTLCHVSWYRKIWLPDTKVTTKDTSCYLHTKGSGGWSVGADL